MLGGRLRKGVGSIVALLFIIGAVMIIFIVIDFSIRSQEKLREIQSEKSASLAESIALMKAVSGVWLYTESTGVLTINITNNYSEPVTITGLIVIYSDKSYDLIREDFSDISGRLLEAVIVSDGGTSTISSLPTWLGIGETLMIRIDTGGKNPVSVRYASTTSKSLAGISSEQYVPAGGNVTFVPNYRVALAPQIMSEGTITTLGYGFASYDVDASSISTVYGSYVSGDVSSVRVDDTDYYIIDGSTLSTWLSGWLYRKPITIIELSGENLENYPIKVLLDTSNFDFSKAKSDGSDIRFTLSDGVTLIPYWIEEWNYGVDATIWVKVPEIPALDTVTIYMYYGNPSASSPGYSVEDVFTLIGESGKVDIDETGGTVYFSGTYDSPPLIFATIDTFNGGDTVVSRVTERTPTYFNIRLEEYPSDDGSHVYETVGWIALKPGVWVVGGKIWEVGEVSVNNVWTSVSFSYAFSAEPAIMTYINTYNEGGFSGQPDAGAHTRQDNPSTTGFDVKIEEETDTSHTYETVGYLAVETGTGTTVNSIGFEASTVSNVRHIWKSYFFSYSFSNTPVVVFKVETENEGDNCHERLEVSSIFFFWYALQETPIYDGKHKKEKGGFIAVEPGLIYGYEYVSPYPSVNVGDEENISYFSEAEVTFTGLPSDTIALDVDTILMCNTTGTVRLKLYDYTLSEWSVILEESYTNPGSEEEYSVSVSAGTYVSSGGEVKLRVSIETGAKHRFYIDLAGLGYKVVSGEVKIFVGVGGSNSFYTYSISSEDWSELSAAPITFDASTCMTFDQDRYVIWVIKADTLYKYDISFDTWETYDTLPFTVGEGCSVFYLDDELYVIVGGGSTELYSYDIPSKTPSPLSSVPEAVGGYSVAEIVSTSIYLIVGGSSNFYRYSIVGDNWVNLVSLYDSAIPPTIYPVGFTYGDNKLWLIGSGGGIHYYDLSGNAWHPYSTQIPYTPLYQGNRLEYYNHRLYHIRDDYTRELWIISVSG